MYVCCFWINAFASTSNSTACTVSRGLCLMSFVQHISSICRCIALPLQSLPGTSVAPASSSFKSGCSNHPSCFGRPLQSHHCPNFHGLSYLLWQNHLKKIIYEALSCHNIVLWKLPPCIINLPRIIFICCSPWHDGFSSLKLCLCKTFLHSSFPNLPP